MSLRPYQRVAYESCINNERGIINHACGTGKTRIEVALALTYKTSIVIAPRNSLISQHQELFETVIKHFNFNTKIFIINCENDIPKYNYDGNCVYIVNNSSLKNVIFENVIVPDVIIVDEAHTHQSSVKNFCMKFQDVRRYFFTATPQDMTSDFYGSTLDTFSYVQARDLGIVCDFRIVPIFDDANYDKELITKMMKYDLRHCIHYYKDVKNDLKEGWNKFKNIWNSMKLTGKTSIEERTKTFEKFKKSTCTLLSCKTISYGIDIH